MVRLPWAKSQFPLRAASIVAVCFVAVWCSATVASAQRAPLTVIDMIGGAVSDPASGQYKEVGDALQEFFVNRNPLAARDLLKVAKKKNPKLPPAEIMMAKILAAGNNGAMARQELEQGVVDNPKDPEFYVFFGDIAFLERRYTDAELLYTKAEALTAAFNDNPKRKRDFTIRIHNGLAGVAETRNRPEYWQVAYDRLSAWLKEDPDSVAAHQRVGRALFRLNKPNEAFQAFRAASDAGGRTKVRVLPAEVHIARLYEESGNPAEASKQMTNAVKVYPADLDTQVAAAQWALQAGKLEDALKYADSAVKLDPKSVDAQVTRGLVARLQSDLKVAEECFNTAFTLAPGNVGAANQLALSLAEQGDRDKQRRALDIAERNARLAPTSREAAATLAWIYYLLSRFDDADRVMQLTTTGGAVTPDAAYYIAKIYEQRGKIAEAKILVQQALETKQPFVHRRDADTLRAQLDQRRDAPKTP